MHDSSNEPTEDEEYGSDEDSDDDTEDVVSKVCDIVMSHCGGTQEVGFDAITQSVKSTTEFVPSGNATPTGSTPSTSTAAQQPHGKTFLF